MKWSGREVVTTLSLAIAREMSPRFTLVVMHVAPDNHVLVDTIHVSVKLHYSNPVSCKEVFVCYSVNVTNYLDINFCFLFAALSFLYVVCLFMYLFSLFLMFRFLTTHFTHFLHICFF